MTVAVRFALISSVIGVNPGFLVQGIWDGSKENSSHETRNFIMPPALTVVT